ncbi:MFS general substrate transporter [Setomelanomma holmii]|uniref:MFS general substrate transporter n=1 Tax=Setomelanomma holmii TaxID=210430 RepID=A0A9P4LFQ7_9PLEO|nr:MFS general substrate transporter [Setomelanomma holmii]
MLEASYKTSYKTWGVIFVLAIGWGTCTLANVGPSTTSSFVAKSLSGSESSAWIPNAALFPLIGLQPLWGALGDRFGKKWFMVTGGLFGVVGNIVAGRATTVRQVIAGQAINGIGSSLLLLVTPTSMEVVPAETRPYAQGFAAFINGIMAIIGLMSAGGWRWAYYFNAIFFGLSGLLITVFYHPPLTQLRREQSIMAELKSLDIIGVMLLLAGVICIVTALTFGGNIYSWDSPSVMAPLVIGIGMLIAFCSFETWGRKDGLIDHRFLQSRNFLVVLFVGFIDGMLLYGVNAFFPVEAQAIFTNNLLKINLYLLPLNIMVLIGCLLSAFVLGRLRHFRALLVVSLVLLALFLGLLALVTPSRVAIALVFTAVVGLCTGVTTVLPVVILSYSIPSFLLGTGGTILASTRALGGVVGITIFATVYGNTMKWSVADVLGVTDQILAAATKAIADVSARAFRYVWIINMAAAVAAALLCLLLRSVNNRMTRHVESALENSKLRAKQMLK